MNVKTAPEPFNAQRQSQIDHEEYQFGFQAAMRGELNNTSQTLAWHRGWADAQELRVFSHTDSDIHVAPDLKQKKPPPPILIRGPMMGTFGVLHADKPTKADRPRVFAPIDYFDCVRLPRVSTNGEYFSNRQT